MDIDSLIMATCAVIGVAYWLVNLFFENHVYLTYKDQTIPQSKKGAKR